MIMRNFAVFGDICYSDSPDRLVCREDSYVVCENGKSAGVFSVLPEKYRGIEVVDFKGMLVTPGFIDLHMHAPQYAYRGMGMDLELLDWLNTMAFPEESKYADAEYSSAAYSIFVKDLVKSPTTRACIFATIHRKATTELMRRLSETGMICFVGKVNMDRNSPDYYRETTAGSIDSTVKWLEESSGFENIRPIITPRFIPSCSDDLMKELARIAEERKLPVQSHLSENMSEIEWVRRLVPESSGYADAYDRFGMLGQSGPSVMAHCIYLTDEETELLKKRGTFVAHSPQSNMNLSSGMAPVRKLLEAGVKCGLASDVAGGSSIDMFRAVTDAIQVSKLRWRIIDESFRALTFPESFYLATKGGGEFFGRAGSFEAGYEFDLIAIDDSSEAAPFELNTVQRLERVMYHGNSGFIRGKFAGGRRIF